MSRRSEFFGGSRPPLRPKRSAYGLAGLRSGRASESVKPGGPNEGIEVGQIELTNTRLGTRGQHAYEEHQYEDWKDSHRIFFLKRLLPLSVR